MEKKDYKIVLYCLECNEELIFVEEKAKKFLYQCSKCGNTMLVWRKYSSNK